MPETASQYLLNDCSQPHAIVCSQDVPQRMRLARCASKDVPHKMRLAAVLASEDAPQSACLYLHTGSAWTNDNGVASMKAFRGHGPQVHTHMHTHTHTHMNSPCVGEVCHDAHVGHRQGAQAGAWRQLRKVIQRIAKQLYGTW
eukprot:43403-Pelagomonas_calceolata.AAC.5